MPVWTLSKIALLSRAAIRERSCPRSRYSPATAEAAGKELVGNDQDGRCPTGLRIGQGTQQTREYDALEKGTSGTPTSQTTRPPDSKFNDLLGDP